MKQLSLIFCLHQPLPLAKYRFFDIGTRQEYFDHFTAEIQVKKAAEKSYIPALQMFLRQIGRWGEAVKLAVFISGSAIDLFKRYSPEVIHLLKELAATGQCEFIGGTWSNSLASLENEKALAMQVTRHKEAVRELTGQTTELFLNPELIYSDQIGATIGELGFKGVITEGARHVLGWKSPGFLYGNRFNPRLKIVMRHSSLSNDFEYRFSETENRTLPNTADKLFKLLLNEPQQSEITNLCLDLDTLGFYYPASSGIFNFFDHLTFLVSHSPEISLATPSEIIARLEPVSLINVPLPLSKAGDEQDISLWNGNDLQNEALKQLFKLTDQMEKTGDQKLITDWHFLQDCEHFRFMSENITEPPLHHRNNPFDSPYEAFINYMNILNDISVRINST